MEFLYEVNTVTPLIVFLFKKQGEMNQEKYNTLIEFLADNPSLFLQNSWDSYVRQQKETPLDTLDKLVNEFFKEINSNKYYQPFLNEPKHYSEYINSQIVSIIGAIKNYISLFAKDVDDGTDRAQFRKFVKSSLENKVTKIRNTLRDLLLKLQNERLNTKEARFEEFLKRYGREFELLTTVEGKVRFIKAEIGKMESILSKVEKESLIGQNAAYFDGAIMCKDYLEKELNKLEPPMLNDSNNSLPKLKWKGKQKQLAELFLTLEEKGWIEPIQDGERTAICKNILRLFDNAGEVKSFNQIMKPDTDKATKKKTYPQVFTARLKKKFSEIKRP